MDTISQFAHHKYINLETLRRNGSKIRTPVWFVQDGDRLFIQTLADSGKVKRIRNNPQVNIAPCRVDGTPVGNWLPANAFEVGDEESINIVNTLMKKKYGLLHKIYTYRSAREDIRRAVLEILIK